MDNEFSQPSLVPAALPASFENDAGVTKTDLANAILEHLKKSQITGLTQSSPNPFDVTQIASDLKALEARVLIVEDKSLIIRRRYTGVVAGDVKDITFIDIGTTNYEVIVNKIVTSANGGGNFGSWAFIDGFKTSTGFRIRFAGQTVPIDVELTARKTPVPYA